MRLRTSGIAGLAGEDYLHFTIVAVKPLLPALVSTILMIPMWGCGASAPLQGHWTGTIEHAGAVAAVTFDVDGRLRGRLSAEDSGIFDVPVAVHADAADVDAEIVRSSGTVRFHGHRNGKVIEGLARVGDFIAHVHLEREGAEQSARFTEIETSVPTATRRLGATLLMPIATHRVPAVVLIHGSHGPDREDLRGPASIFARNGIAALIYDKRDLGADQSQPHRYSFRELADDARAAVKVLRQRSDIDGDAVGIFGISEGGWVAPLVAESNRDVAFVLVVAAPAVSYAMVEDVMTAAQLRAADGSDADVAAMLRLFHQVNDYVRHGGEAGALTAQLVAASHQRWANSVAIPRRAPTTADIRTDVRWRELDYEPAEHWRRVQVPVFGAWGADDLHPVTESVAAIRSALGKDRHDVSLHVYPRATHELLVSSQRGSAWQWPRLAPGFIDDMIRWATARSRRQQDGARHSH